MSSGSMIVDINELPKVDNDFNLNQITSNQKLFDAYSPYLLYLEDREYVENEQDVPIEYKYNLYKLFTAGIDNIYADGGEITIGEQISSTTQFLCNNNYMEINDTQLHSVDTNIDFDRINTFVQKLHTWAEDPNVSYEEVSAKVFNWFATFPGINLEINPNPEDADDTNLVLPQAIRNDIKSITESILSKFFRNLIQLVRVVHDYRLYGKNATIFGGRSDTFENKTNIGKWSAVPSSTWTEYSGNYVVGKSAYNDDLENVETSTIANSRYLIGPYNSWGVAPHTHEVSFNIAAMSSSFGFERDVWNTFAVEQHEKGPAHIDDRNSLLSSWRQIAEASFQTNSGGKRNGTVSGYANKGTEQANIKVTTKWGYSWTTNDYCKLMTVSTVENIYQQSNTVLPTYATYVWKWTGEDDTNIINPTKYF